MVGFSKLRVIMALGFGLVLFWASRTWADEIDFECSGPGQDGTRVDLTVRPQRKDPGFKYWIIVDGLREKELIFPCQRVESHETSVSSDDVAVTFESKHYVGMRLEIHPYNHDGPLKADFWIGGGEPLELQCYRYVTID